MHQLLEMVLSQPRFEPLFDGQKHISITTRFAFDGSKITKTKNSVRGVMKYIPADISQRKAKDRPDDELFLLMYMGK